jgi:zinc protease
LRGTQKQQRTSFAQALDALGSSLDVSVGQDATYFRGACLKRFLKPTVQLLADALNTPALHQDEWTLLQEEMLEEQQSVVDDDESLAEYFLRKQLYADTPLSRSVLGEVEDISRFAQEEVRKVFSDVYPHTRKICGFAGDMSLQDMQECMALLRLSSSETSLQAASDMYQVPAVSSSFTCLIVDKPDRTQVQVRLGQIAVDAYHPDALHLWLAVLAFGGTFTSPFTQEIRDMRGWSYFASTDFYRYAMHPSSVILRTAPALQDAVPCLALQTTLFDAFKEGTLQEEALFLARAYALRTFPFQIATAKDVLSLVLTYALVGLEPSTLFEEPAHLESIDLHSVMGRVQPLLQNTPAHAVMVGPASVLYDQVAQQFPGASINTVDFRTGLILKP